MHDVAAKRIARVGKLSLTWMLSGVPGAFQGGRWGYYSAEQLPQLVAWLENGSDGEQAIADAVFEAYQELLPPVLSGRPPERQQPRPQPADGYAGLPPLRSGRDQLAEVRFCARAAP